MKAIQGALVSTLDLEWYEARSDSFKDAEAQRNLDLIRNCGNAPLFPTFGQNGNSN